MEIQETEATGELIPHQIAEQEIDRNYLRHRPADAYTFEISDGVRVHIWPRVRVSWETFKSEFPPFSIGIDGFVTGAPRFDFEGPYRNFNHHEDVDRDATRSTCAQVHMAIKRGLFERFAVDGHPQAEIFIEDPDQDVCYSLWLLKNHERISGERSEPLINRLLYIEDILDSSAGMYPQDPTSKLMRQVAWIFDPYVQSRIEGKLFQLSGSEMANLIISVGDNITQYTLGEGKTRELDTAYSVIGGGPNWSLVKEEGFYARAAYRHDAIGAFVSVIENAGRTFAYSIGKTSPYHPFPLTEIYSVLNFHESEPCWGGGDTIGGSRGGKGSSLCPSEVEQCINTFLIARAEQTQAVRGLSS